MKWAGSGALRWVRPLHSILCLLEDEHGTEVVPLTVDGITAGDTTEGHRFLSKGRLKVTSFDDYAAKLQGAQIAYDVGIQRTCWQTHSLTNWMGDAGFLKESTSQYRAHVYLSDVVQLGGRVEAKEIDADGNHVVRLYTWAHNQRSQNVMPGTAVIVLPVRDPTGNPADKSTQN